MAYPDKTLHKVRCLVPHELEALRFFMSTDKDCTLSPGSQTRRRFEANMVCGKGAEQLTWRVALESPDRMRFTLKATARHQGQTVTFSSTARWLQDSCNVHGIPIS